ncbi:MAG: UDP-N-acetylglucosamine 2-epimerase (non-hydrolyzing) [Balneolaceae bacterium]
MVKNRKKIVVVVGARPQFIKLSALSRKLTSTFNEVVIHTGQHYDKNMSSVFFDELNLTVPKYNLATGSDRQGAQTGHMLNKIEQVLLDEKPKMVIVFGDTNSTLAGALAASKLQIPIVHIEAGLRSFNREMPEEINRVLTDHVSDLLLAPTETAVKNLEQEGLRSNSRLTGDIMVDSLLNNCEIAEKNSKVLLDLKLDEESYYTATLHRPYNVDQKKNLVKILDELNMLEKKVVFPVHPRTKQKISDFGIKVEDNILLIEPLGFLDFVKLLMYSNKIITDSGGIQKEAYILKKPCITLRPETEWIETVEAGWNLLISTSAKDFHAEIENFTPLQPHRDIFGEDVTEKMMVEIKGLVN